MVLLVKPSFARRALDEAETYAASIRTAGFQCVVIIPKLWSRALFQVTSIAAAVRSPAEASLRGFADEASLSLSLTGRRAVEQNVPVL